MKIFKFLGATLAFSALLAACGGGGGNTLTAPPTHPGGGGATVAAIAVSSNPATVAADGSTTAKITAVARDASNAAVTGAVLSFSVTTGGLLTNVSATTGRSHMDSAEANQRVRDDQRPKELRKGYERRFFVYHSTTPAWHGPIACVLVIKTGPFNDPLSLIQWLPVSSPFPLCE